MFEEFLRELRQMSQPVEVPIPLELDSKGYLDRCCPHPECQASFKVDSQDWTDKVPDDLATCPKCGGRSEPTTFNTPSQNDYIAAFAEAYMARQLNDAFSRAARKTRRRRMSSELLNVDICVSYKPGAVYEPSSPDATEPLRQDLSCAKCGCHFSTLGAGYFCPACGFNDPLTDVANTIEMSRKTVELLPSLETSFTQSRDVDSAHTFINQLLESQITQLIAAFQRGTEFLFAQLPNAGTFKYDQNTFQRLDDSSTLWKLATGVTYESILTTSEMECLRIMLQRRHKLGHSQGIVDSTYLKKSGDTSYTIGQRLVTTPEHVLELADVLGRLFDGLRRLVP